MRGRVLISLALLIASIGVAATPTVRAEPGGAPIGGPTPFERVNDARRLSLGHETACVILDSGNLRCWGSNNVGQAGVGVPGVAVIGDDETADAFPTIDLAGQFVDEVATSEGHSCALMRDRNVRCWGGQTFGAVLGVPGSENRVGDDEAPATIGPVALGGDAQAIAVGNFHSCALLIDGSIRCWGNARHGQLGYGSEQEVGDNETPAQLGPVPIGPGRTAFKIDAGRRHTCALLDGAEILCWGERTAIKGGLQSGAGAFPDYGDDEPASAGPLVTAADLGGSAPAAVSAGDRSTCAINEIGDVYCWGNGEVATNSTGVNAVVLNPAKVDLGGRTARAIDLGFSHACVIFEGGGVGCWGEGDGGRLGYGDTDDVGDDEPPLSKGLVDIGAGRTAKAVSAGNSGTCVLRDNDTLLCWGDGRNGVPGGANTIDIGDDEPPSAAPPVNFVGTAAYRPVTPYRVLETRAGLSGPGPIQGKGVVGPGERIDVQITGTGGPNGIPDTGVYAVVLNLTLAQALARGFVTAYTFGTSRPTASNLNVTAAGQTAPNKVIVPVSPDGKISIFTLGGGHLIADVFGYFEATASSDAGRLIGVDPSRVLETRPGLSPPGQKGKLGPGREIELRVTGRNGVPGSGVSAVVLNVTGVEGNDRGFITVYPGNVTRPTTSNINLAGPGATRPNTVIVPVSPAGTIKIFAQQGAHIVVDVTAFFTDSSAPDTDDGLFVRINPSRLGDSRSVGVGPLLPGGRVQFNVAGRLGIPFTANAGVFNLTATESRDRGFVTGYPTEITRPDTSNLNLPGPNETIANLAVLPLRPPSGSITLFTQTGASLIMDTTGYFL